eukprot:CAMPEP_0118886322 /NCGR_PEP_ID=MMETSP1163-20130328/24447_1 /TAXON_ID=124430 /ORGANISM="Phaeomonas parva, Strain CCMP2877" /LENGTH=64 /DNA_ID=CAMNT_0006824505 /DNA_START=305 /DNA_END=499 /DNA_ORIENTATION=-
MAAIHRLGSDGGCITDEGIGGRGCRAPAIGSLLPVNLRARLWYSSISIEKLWYSSISAANTDPE